MRLAFLLGGPHDFLPPAPSQKFGGHNAVQGRIQSPEIVMGYIQHLPPEYQEPRVSGYTRQDALEQL